ncbi:MAG: AsmA-like C-terminal region-containing protein, partial [Pseudomonadota bacterium]|nr:AsmA-like C-terminal region-containing protein [Pseudomonadota bacterium]
LSVKGNIKARGETPADFMTNLNGQGTLSLRGGQIIGADVEQMIPIITRAIQRSEGAKVIEPEFKRVLNSGKTVLQTVSGDYVIANGVVRMMDLTLNTANAIANPTQIIWDIPKRTLDISIPVLLKPLNSLPPFILGISVLANQGTYKPNYADLLAVLSNRSQTALANDLRQKEAYAREAAMRKRSDRLAESKSLTADARTAVANMEQKMVEFPFEKGSRLLATAKDTLVLLNQLAVKEDPTDAQLIQQIEYARTVLLKADEFNRALEQETLFSTQKKMAEYRQKSTQMAEQLKLWAKAYPDIVVLAKLSDNAEQNRQIVEQSTAKLSSKMSVAEANELVGTCAEAVDKIEKAYQHATRFDLSGVPNQVTGENYTPKKQVRGSFKRSE